MRRMQADKERPRTHHLKPIPNLLRLVTLFPSSEPDWTRLVEGIHTENASWWIRTDPQLQAMFDELIVRVSLELDVSTQSKHQIKGNVPV
jgi:hypothetical protein